MARYAVKQKSSGSWGPWREVELGVDPAIDFILSDLLMRRGFWQLTLDDGASGVKRRYRKVSG